MTKISDILRATPSLILPVLLMCMVAIIKVEAQSGYLPEDEGTQIQTHCELFQEFVNISYIDMSPSVHSFSDSNVFVTKLSIV